MPESLGPCRCSWTCCEGPSSSRGPSTRAPHRGQCRRVPEDADAAEPLLLEEGAARLPAEVRARVAEAGLRRNCKSCQQKEAEPAEPAEGMFNWEPARVPTFPTLLRRIHARSLSCRTTRRAGGASSPTRSARRAATAWPSAGAASRTPWPWSACSSTTLAGTPTFRMTRMARYVMLSRATPASEARRRSSKRGAARYGGHGTGLGYPDIRGGGGRGRIRGSRAQGAVRAQEDRWLRYFNKRKGFQVSESREDWDEVVRVLKW